MALQVDVISDVVCPWCFIGKARLDQALTQWRRDHPDEAVEVAWHAFQLNPGMPVEGVDRQPCGGTHVANTADIGAVVVTKIEKKSAMTRRVVLGFAPAADAPR